MHCQITQPDSSALSCHDPSVQSLCGCCTGGGVQVYPYGLTVGTTMLPPEAGVVAGVFVAGVEVATALVVVATTCCCVATGAALEHVMAARVFGPVVPAPGVCAEVMRCVESCHVMSFCRVRGPK